MKGSTRLECTGFHGGLGHLKIETRLVDERLSSVMGECEIVTLYLDLYIVFRETCPSFSPFRFRFRSLSGTTFETQYPHVVEIEIEKVRKKDTFTAIRCTQSCRLAAFSRECEHLRRSEKKKVNLSY
jgi:hypothetical protein